MFNTFGKSKKVYDAGIQIWHRVVSAFPIGGKISNLSDFSAGDIIPSGVPAYLNTADSTVKVVCVPFYDAASKYAVGDKVIYSGALYKCISAISTPEEFDPDHWAEVTGGIVGIADYSASATYAVGDKCKHSNKYYVCKTAISSPEAWTAAHWDEDHSVDAVYNDFENVNGLLRHDVNLDEAVFDAETGAATASVVFEGVVLSSRLFYGVPDFVWAKLPNITQYKEV